MRLVALAINGETVCGVSMSDASWLPVRPKVPRVWLRNLYAAILRNYFML